LAIATTRSLALVISWTQPPAQFCRCSRRFTLRQLRRDQASFVVMTLSGVPRSGVVFESVQPVLVDAGLEAFPEVARMPWPTAESREQSESLNGKSFTL